MAEESQTEQSRAYFYRNFTYTRDHLARDYLAELHNYHDDSWNTLNEQPVSVRP
jgi:hypothetical protein